MPSGYSQLTSTQPGIGALAENTEQSIGDLAERTRSIKSVFASHLPVQDLGAATAYEFVEPSVTLAIPPHADPGSGVLVTQGNPFIFVEYSFEVDVCETTGAVGVLAYTAIADSLEAPTPILSATLGYSIAMNTTRTGCGGAEVYRAFRHERASTYAALVPGDHVIQIGFWAPDPDVRIKVRNMEIEAGVL